MKRDQQFASIGRICGPEKEALGVLATEIDLAAGLRTRSAGRTVTSIWTAGGGNPAAISPLSPLAVPLLLKPLYRPGLASDSPWTRLARIISARPIDWELIARNYGQLVKYATALRLGTAETGQVLRRFTRGGGPKHPTYAALEELGRAVRTISSCATTCPLRKCAWRCTVAWR